MEETPRKPRLGWLAWESDQTSGYAHVAGNIRRALGILGAEFVNAYQEDGDLEVAVCTPVRKLVRGLQKRPELVIHTMFEALNLPPGWVDNLNAAGLIWVPAEHSRALFHASGVTTPIIKAGYGVDLNAYTYFDRSGRDGPMRFGIWADTLISRKNVVKAVWSFINAGLPDAELEVKLHSFAGMSADTAFADRDDRPLANITLHTGAWPRSKLVRWLESLDCMIYLSGGEGFGLMPLEAAATGLTTICHNCSGMSEYLTPDAFLLVEGNGTEQVVSYSVGYHYPCFMPKPNYDQAVDLIRWAYKNRDEVYRLGGQARLVAEQWDWQEQVAKGWARLQAYYKTIS